MPILPLSAARYHKHTLHYMLKGLGYLPAAVLERLNRYLNAPTAAQYPHADAHLRLILGINRHLKRPLKIAELTQLRHKFATDAIAMHAPTVWQQPHADDRLKNKNITTKKNTGRVSWQDKTIANADGEDMIVRCYQAELDEQQNADAVVMLFLHGGGFCIGDVDTHHEFCHAICAQTGWAVVSVDYRLAPEHPAPAALRDCLTAYAWLAEQAHTFGALSSRIVLAGDSAGGCLAILTAQQVIAPSATPWQIFGSAVADSLEHLIKDLPRPLAQLPLYPVTDIENNYPSWALYGQGLLLDHEDVEVFDAAYMQHPSLSSTHPLISPMYGDNTQMCPSYIVAAELDILRDEAQAYGKALQSAGVKVQTHTVLGAPHGFIHLMSLHQGLGHETNAIIDNFANFVRQLLINTAT